MFAMINFRSSAALTVVTCKKYILTYFQKLKSFHLLMTEDDLLGKVRGQTFFRPETEWDEQTVPLN